MNANTRNGLFALFAIACGVAAYRNRARIQRLLESRGIEVTNMKSGMDHSIQAWIKDPDGNAIELMEYTHESLQLRRTVPA